jgi:translation initiation factor IF-3
MNFGKYRYEQQKKEHQAKKRSASQELKELRLGRSIRIEKHDFETKLKKAREIIGKGNRLQVFLQLRGREQAHFSMGIDRLNEFAEALEDVSRIDQPATKMGRRILMVLTPLTAGSSKGGGKSKVKKKGGPAKSDSEKAEKSS